MPGSAKRARRRRARIAEDHARIQKEIDGLLVRIETTLSLNEMVAAQEELARLLKSIRDSEHRVWSFKFGNRPSPKASPDEQVEWAETMAMVAQIVNPRLSG